MKYLKEDQDVKAPEEVEQCISKTATELGLAKEWRSAQGLVSDTKGNEEEILKVAIERYRKPNIDLGE